MFFTFQLKKWFHSFTGVTHSNVWNGILVIFLSYQVLQFQLNYSLYECTMYVNLSVILNFFKVAEIIERLKGAGDWRPRQGEGSFIYTIYILKEQRTQVESVMCIYGDWRMVKLKMFVFLIYFKCVIKSTLFFFICHSFGLSFNIFSKW